MKDLRYELKAYTRPTLSPGGYGCSGLVDCVGRQGG